MTLLDGLRARLGARLVEYSSREDWLADARRGPEDWCLGGTTAADILGVGFGGPWRAWAAGQGSAEDVAVSDVMRAGTEWEPLVLRWYAEHYGREVVAPLCRVVHASAPWLRPSPDGFSRDGDGDGMVEIKCPFRREGWGDDGAVVRRADADALAVVPPGYLVQVYVGLAASACAWCDVVTCFGPQDTRIVRVLADVEYQTRLVADLAEWRERHLIRGEPPEVDASDACSAYLAMDRDGVRDATDAEADLVADYAEARTAEHAAEARKRAAGARLLALMGSTKTILADLGGPSPVRLTAGSRGLVLTGLE